MVRDHLCQTLFARHYLPDVLCQTLLIIIANNTQKLLLISPFACPTSQRYSFGFFTFYHPILARFGTFAEMAIPQVSKPIVSKGDTSISNQDSKGAAAPRPVATSSTKNDDKTTTTRATTTTQQPVNKANPRAGPSIGYNRVAKSPAKRTVAPRPLAATSSTKNDDKTTTTRATTQQPVNKANPRAGSSLAYKTVAKHAAEPASSSSSGAPRRLISYYPIVKFDVYVADYLSLGTSLRPVREHAKKMREGERVEFRLKLIKKVHPNQYGPGEKPDRSFLLPPSGSLVFVIEYELLSDIIVPKGIVSPDCNGVPLLPYDKVWTWYWEEEGGTESGSRTQRGHRPGCSRPGRVFGGQL